MISVLQSMIVDFQEAAIATGTARHLQLEHLSGKASICIGARRSGKSTYMHQIMAKLMTQGVSQKNIVHLNFFDDRLYQLPQVGFNTILEAYYGLYPEKKNTETVYYFFDEIQMIAGWEAFIERLLRTEKCEVYLTGSSAKMLSKEIATQMRGRALSWELFPFSFAEYLDHTQLEVTYPLSTKTRLLVQQAFNEYCTTGGFPEVLGYNKMMRIKVHQEYFNAMLFRDLIERHKVVHPKIVLDLAHWLVNNIAALYSINSLYGYLQSLGHKVQKTAVSEYLQRLEDAYFFFTVRIFDASVARMQANPKKIYCIDHAMVNSLASGILVNSGHLLENMVFMGLRRITPHVFYYKTKSGKEVDFLIQQKAGKKVLIQVSETLLDPKTEKREVGALVESMLELNLKQGIIVTRQEQGEVTTEAGVITIVPIWKFLLDVEGWKEN